MPNDRLNLTRAQLGQFLRDHQAIRQFELLFSVASELMPDTVDALKIEAGSAGAKAEMAMGLLQSISNSLETIASAPVAVDPVLDDDLTSAWQACMQQDDLPPAHSVAVQQDDLTPPPVPVTVEYVPIGTVAAFRFGTIPNGWLELDGQTVNTADYPELAALYGAGGATMALDDWRDLPLWGDGDETQGSIVGNDDRGITADLSGDNTSWTDTGESVLTIADATATTTDLTAGAVPVAHTGTHSHSVSGGNHDHTIETYEYQDTPSGGETVTDDAMSILPRRAIIKWIIKARRAA